MSLSEADSEYMTPLQSQHISSLTSCSSIYYSLSDLHDFESCSEMNTSTKDSVELIHMQELPSEEFNGFPNKKILSREDLCLSDGIRSIDFVLVYREDPSRDDYELITQRRNIFHKNLQEEGLVLETDAIDDVPLRFVKIHCTFEVCTRYAEILKLRMPMKKKMDDSLLKNRVVFHIPGIMAIELNPPDVLVDISDYLSRIFNFLSVDSEIFPPRNKHFTAIYSRNKEYLFDITENFFTPAVRSRIAEFILRRKRFSENEENHFAFGIDKLIADDVYEAAYPIHEGDLSSGKSKRAVLYKHWATLKNFYKYQPLDDIKDYFGVKIGLYFAWLGFYTYMLIPASIVGLLCFLYAIFTIHLHQPSNDICNPNLNITMCPLCDDFCDYWDLKETCFHAKFTYLVDNPATVVFACFMSFWAALFLEMWKRYAAEITHRWDLTGFDIQEDHPRPEYLARLSKVKKKHINIITGQYEPKPPFWRMRFPGVLLSMSSVILLVMMALVAVFGVILYRMSVLAAIAALSFRTDSTLQSHAIIFTSATAAFINLVCIMIFNLIYARFAKFLTELELQRTQTEFDDSLTLKIYLLQFINYYTSIFYIAFFKGKSVGHPGNYNRIFGFRQEECSPGGCLLELSVQLAIIMVGKQIMNSIMEMFVPIIYTYMRLLTVPKSKREATSTWPRWAKDFKLVDFDPRGLFPEYLEMVLQYGFVTIFVSCFPLAPLFAFLNNMFEMRLDAKKMLTHFRRPVSQRVKDIGVWFRILDSIGKFAVITNAFIIAFTSNFIPELVYRHVISQDKSLNGFLNHSLSTFDVNNFPAEYAPRFNTTVDNCRYPDYRNEPGARKEYEYSSIFWHILAARLAFVVVFENVVCVVMLFIKWLIPDVAFSLKEKIRREAYVTNELIVTNELVRARRENSESKPIRRQMSEPLRSKSKVHEVRFA